ncbi:helix-turn-helix domain-containing protein [Vibrio artabrorum]|uniref:helix-turn-helix domain-containing protein n=1 Tax=Vibrio artabrorum TaxID=446374 RepID=UPI003B00DEEA
MKVHLLALAHFKDSLSRAQIVKALKVSRNSVNKWVKTFLKKVWKDLKRNPAQVDQPTSLKDNENNSTSL